MSMGLKIGPEDKKRNLWWTVLPSFLEALLPLDIIVLKGNTCSCGSTLATCLRMMSGEGRQSTETGRPWA